MRLGLEGVGQAGECVRRAVRTHGLHPLSRATGRMHSADTMKPTDVKSRREPSSGTPALATIATSAGLSALAARLVTCGMARWMRACA